MNRKEFIGEVMHFIVDKRNRPLIVEELNNHIDDRIAYYTDAGYSLEKAEEMAISKMGEPSVIATDMDKLYSTRSNIAIQSAVLVMYVLYMIASRLFLLGMYDSLSSVSVFLELRLFITTFVVLAIAQKRRLPLLSIFALVHVVLYYVFRVSGVYADDYTSYIVYFLNSLLTGNIGKYSFFMSSYLASKGSNAVLLESKIMILLLAIIAIAVTIVIILSNKRIDARKINKLGNGMICAIFALFVIGVAGWGCVYISDGSSMCTYDDVYIYESNEKLDDVSKMEFTHIMIDYDWEPNPLVSVWDAFDDPPCTEEYVQFDSFVSYKRCTTTISHMTNKKYVMVVMKADDEIEPNILDKSTGWVEANGYTFHDSIHYKQPSFDDLIIEFRGNE